MPTPLKLAALIVTILGLFIALELTTLTSKQFKSRPNQTLYHFSNILGFYPLITHRFPPLANLALGQTVATQIIDQTWFEKVGPKAITETTRPIAATVSNIQRGSIKTYLTFFILTLFLILSLSPL